MKLIKKLLTSKIHGVYTVGNKKKGVLKMNETITVHMYYGGYLDYSTQEHGDTICLVKNGKDFDLVFPEELGEYLSDWLFNIKGQATDLMDKFGKTALNTYVEYLSYQELREEEEKILLDEVPDYIYNTVQDADDVAYLTNNIKISKD